MYSKLTVDQTCYLASDIKYKGLRSKFGRTYNIRIRMKQINLDCIYIVQLYKDNQLCTAKETELIVGRIVKNFIDAPTKETFNRKKWNKILKLLAKTHIFDGIKYKFKLLKY